MLNIAHRGFSSKYPENTVLAFEKALELGVEWFETDVHFTKDGHPVIMHDATVDRTTNGSGAVADLTLEEIAALDAGIHKGAEFQGEPVPTFADVLARFGKRAGIVVELKFRGNELIRPALDAIAAHDCEDSVVISSFDLAKLPVVRSLAPILPVTALLRLEGRPPEQVVAEVADLGADTIGPRGEEVTPELVECAHEAGLLVRAWGLGDDRGPLMRRLIAMGVDGTTTDHPDALQDILNGS